MKRTLINKIQKDRKRAEEQHRFKLIYGDNLERKYPLNEKDFIEIIKFMIPQPDDIKILVNSIFLKALLDEVVFLRDSKESRLRVVYDRERERFESSRKEFEGESRTTE